jgi:hypothetical protein
VQKNKIRNPNSECKNRDLLFTIHPASEFFLENKHLSFKCQKNKAGVKDVEWSVEVWYRENKNNPMKYKKGYGDRRDWKWVCKMTTHKTVDVCSWWWLVILFCSGRRLKFVWSIKWWNTGTLVPCKHESREMTQLNWVVTTPVSCLGYYGLAAALLTKVYHGFSQSEINMPTGHNHSF